MPRCLIDLIQNKRSGFWKEASLPPAYCLTCYNFLYKKEDDCLSILKTAATLTHLENPK